MYVCMNVWRYACMEICMYEGIIIILLDLIYPRYPVRYIIYSSQGS